MAKAINSKEEYFNLRNSEENRRNLALARQGDEEAKRRLVQFAYNDLMPDGRVAGCCHPSGMFAYDVDCENYEESTRIAQQIIARKQEIGLLEVSVLPVSVYTLFLLGSRARPFSKTRCASRCSPRPRWTREPTTWVA